MPDFETRNLGGSLVPPPPENPTPEPAPAEEDTTTPAIDQVAAVAERKKSRGAK